MRMRRQLVILVALALGGAGTVAAAPAQATSPGSNGRIAFVTHNQIYTMTPAGQDRRRITSSGKNYRPQWNPAGNRIAFIHEVSRTRHELWTMWPSGSHKARVTAPGENVTSAGAAWAPGGRNLAYATTTQSYGDGTLHTRSASAPFRGYRTPQAADTWCGSGERIPVKVTKYLAWSVDGVIAVANQDGCDSPDNYLWFFTPATGDYELQEMSGGSCCGFTEWSNFFFGPDGEFGRTSYDPPGGEFPATRPRISYPGFRSVNEDTQGAPSPDGRSMAVVNTGSGSASIFVGTASGGSRQRIASGYQPDWQPVP